MGLPAAAHSEAWYAPCTAIQPTFGVPSSKWVGVPASRWWAETTSASQLTSPAAIDWRRASVSIWSADPRQVTHVRQREGSDPEPALRAGLDEVLRRQSSVLHDGADAKVREDLELLEALAAFLESEDAEIARLRPTILVAEFAGMMEAAIDLRQELANLQRFGLNFAGEPDVVIPEPFPDQSGQKVLTMAMIVGHPFTDRSSVQAAGWDVEMLVRRAADVYLEMIFRDGLYHADPHPGNFLLPDSQHLAILDFGDVGRLTSQRRAQLESLGDCSTASNGHPQRRHLAKLGRPVPGLEIRIVDPAGKVMQEREAGELQVRARRSRPATTDAPLTPSAHRRATSRAGVPGCAPATSPTPSTASSSCAGGSRRDHHRRSQRLPRGRRARRRPGRGRAHRQRGRLRCRGGRGRERIVVVAEARHDDHDAVRLAAAGTVVDTVGLPAGEVVLVQPGSVVGQAPALAVPHPLLDEDLAPAWARGRLPRAQAALRSAMTCAHRSGSEL